MTQPPTITNLTDKFAALIEALRGGRSVDVVTALVDELSTDIIAELMASPFKDELAGAFGIEFEAKLRAEVGPGLTQIKEAVNVKGDATVEAINQKGDATVGAINLRGENTVNAVGNVDTTLNETIYPAIQELQSVTGGGFGALATGQQTIATALTAITALLRQIERCACQSATLLLGAPWNAATSSGSACENAASDPVTLSYDVRTVGLSSFSAWGAVRNNEITVLANGWANGLGVANTVYTTGDTRVQLIGPRWFAVNLGIGDFFEVGIRSSLPDAQYRFGGQVGYTHHFFVPAQAWIELYATGIEGVNDPASLNLSLGVADCTPVEPPPVWTPTNWCVEYNGAYTQSAALDPANWVFLNAGASGDLYYYNASWNIGGAGYADVGGWHYISGAGGATQQTYCLAVDFEASRIVTLYRQVSLDEGGSAGLKYEEKAGTGSALMTLDRDDTLGNPLVWRLVVEVETGTPASNIYVYLNWPAFAGS